MVFKTGASHSERNISNCLPISDTAPPSLLGHQMNFPCLIFRVRNERNKEFLITGHKWFLLAYTGSRLHHHEKSHTCKICSELHFSRNEIAFPSPLPLISSTKKSWIYILYPGHLFMEDDLHCCALQLKYLMHYQPEKMFHSWMFRVHNFLCGIRQVMEPFLALVYCLWKEIIALAPLREFKVCEALRYYSNRVHTNPNLCI